MDLCDEAGLEMGEAEYALLLEVAALGASWEQVQRVLTRMGQELTVLQLSTLHAAEAYFRRVSTCPSQPSSSTHGPPSHSEIL